MEEVPLSATQRANTGAEELGVITHSSGAVRRPPLPHYIINFNYNIPPPPPTPIPAAAAPALSQRDVYLASISAFLNLLILKWQGIHTTPFHTHPKTMLLFLISCLLLVYFIAFSPPPPYTTRLRTHFLKFFWSLTVASLVSLLLPHGSILTRLAVYVACLAPSIVSGLRDWRQSFQDCVDEHVEIGQRARFFATPTWLPFVRMMMPHVISSHDIPVYQRRVVRVYRRDNHHI